MKKYFFSVMIFCSAILFSLGASIISNAQANLLASASTQEVEIVKDEPPQDLHALQNAGDEQLDHWAKNLESFDGRKYNYITPARDQYQKKTCWAFAAVGAAEANILRKGIDRSATKDNLDLDETITAYTRHVRDGNQDPLFLTTNDKYDYGNWDQGDSGAPNAFSIMTQGYTLVNENHFHTSVSEEELNSKLKQSKYFVKSYQSISNDRDAIKLAILQYGAVAFNYASPITSATKFFKKYKTTDHTSIIVGWDDSVDRSEFSPGKPDSDGAWIIKNSWGTYWGEAGFYYISYEQPIGALYAVDLAMTEDYQNIYHYDGDVTISMIKHAGEAQAAIYEAKLSSSTKQEQLKAVAISVPEGNLDVNVKIYKNLTVNPGNVNDQMNIPDQGDLSLDMNAHIERSGMHTIDLKNPINLEQGEYFSIVVRCKAKTGVSVPVNCAVDKNASVNDMTYYLQDGKWINFKHSDFYADSGTDIRSAKIRAITNTVGRKTDSGNDLKYARVEIANRLLYYAKGKQMLPEIQVYSDGKLLEDGRDYRVEVQKINSPGKTAITVFGKGEYQGTRTAYFEVAKAKNPPEVFPATKSVYNDVTYLREIPSPDGWAWADESIKLEYGTNSVSLIYVGEDKAFYQNLIREFNVNKINQNPPADIDISTAEVEIVGDYVYTGEPIVPSVRVTYETFELRSDIDYTLTFQDNKDAGVATVIVRGNGRYFGEIRQTFVIKKAEKPSVDTTIHHNKKASKLSDIALPEGFAWEDETMEITGNRLTAKAVYTGKDAGNYEITEFTFEIIMEVQEPEKEQGSEQGQGPEQEQEQEQGSEQGQGPEQGSEQGQGPEQGSEQEQGPEQEQEQEQGPGQEQEPEQEQRPEQEQEPEQGQGQEQEPEQGPQQEEQSPEQEQKQEDLKRENLIWVAIVVPVAVLTIAGSGIAIIVYRRKKH